MKLTPKPTALARLQVPATSLVLLAVSSCVVVLGGEEDWRAGEFYPEAPPSPPKGAAGPGGPGGPMAEPTDQLEPFVADHVPARQSYVAYRTADELVIDGRLDEAAWQAAPQTALFVDIQGGDLPTPRYETRARMLWDDEYFYVAAEMEEPHLWGTLTERDSIIFYDNDFEVFLDPDGDTFDYYELEINALGTEWDLLLERPYRNGGPALHEYDTPGLLSGVHLNGTLNDSSDVDSGWTMEIAIPFAALRAIAGRPVPPTDGDVWWVNFSRVQWQLDAVSPEDGGGYVKSVGPEGERLPEDNWVWSPQGVIAMHEPETWGLVMFASETSDMGDGRVFEEPDDLEHREFLRSIFEAQHRFRAKFGRFSEDPRELGLTGGAQWDWPLELHATPSGFEALLEFEQTWDETGKSGARVLHIDEKGHVW